MITTDPKSKPSAMRLYGKGNRRLYINGSERRRFIDVAETQDLQIRAFCLTLLYTGCRLSEARELTQQSLQAQEQLLSFRSLKKRDQHHIREMPIPAVLCQCLNDLAARAEDTDASAKLERTPQIQDNSSPWLWQSPAGDQITRNTAYRWIKDVMAQAGILGPQACPKGLRHGFAVHAIFCGIQLNMVQKWMGHADISTTAIYANAVGREELELAGRMW